MKDINIVIDSQTHKVQFPDNFLGLNAENLQGNINFTFINGFVNGIARLELSIDCESGFIPNLQNTGDSYTLPILSSLLTSDNIVMQLVIEQTDLITYKLTTDTSINNHKTYYTRSGIEGEYVYTIVENPKVADIGTYYEAQIPIFKTHIFNMTVGESINAVNTIPDDYPTWIDTLNSLVGQVNAKIIEMNQALAEVDNLDITATKEGTTVTITITRKDGSQQVVTITDGKDGVGIEKIEKTGTNLLVDTYTIYYTDDSTSTFQVKNGRGIVSIDKTNTNILTDTYTITYNDNTTSTFYVVNGNGVESIVKIGTSGLIDTYRISYTNGEYYDYQVANGNGIDNIQKTDTTGLIDTYTITYTNGTISTYIITNGNGISNIAKTSTVDNIDTYTIYYTNGTTSTFTVTNSTVTNQEFQELQRLVDYNGLYANALIKMNNTGTNLSINDTAEAPMKMSLAPSEMEQATNIITYTCVGTETGDYYFTYNSIDYQFTMPTISAGDVLAFNTTTLELYLGSTQITTTTASTGTLITMSATPNPDYPQEIHTISGDNEIILENKNLLDLSILQQGIWNLADGVISIVSTTDARYRAFQLYLPAGTYTINFDKANNIIRDFTSYSDTWNPLDIVKNNITSKSFTMTENGIVYICFRKYDGNNWDDSTDLVWLNKGTTATPYTPHEEQSRPLNLPVENLFDKDNAEYRNGYYKNDSGVEQALSGSGYISTYISVKPNTNYIFSGTFADNTGGSRIYYYDENKNWLSRSDGNLTSTHQFKTPNNCYYIQLQYNRSIFNANTLQLEQGTKANSYTPYGTTPLEYSKIGNYEDEFVYNTTDTSLEIGKWYLKKNTFKRVLNGTENYRRESSNGYYFIYETLKVPENLTNAVIIIADKLLGRTPSQVITNGNVGISSRRNVGNRGALIRLKQNDTEMTVTQFSEFLAENNITIYSALSTPTYILLNDTLQSQLTEIYKWVKAYQDQTNISQVNNDLPFVIKASAVRDMSNIFDLIQGSEL